MLRWITVLLALSGAVSAASVHFGWDPVADSRLTGYELGWGRATGAYSQYQPAAGTTATLDLAEPGPWHIAVRALAEDAGEPIQSGWSNEVVWAVDAGPTQPLAQTGLWAVWGREGNSMPSIVQSATGITPSSSTSFTITFATAPSSGNKLLLIASVSGSSRQASVDGFSVHDRLVNGSSSMMVLSKTTGASESATYTVNVSGTSELHSGIMLEISGADNSNFFNALALVASLTTPSRTPNVVGVLPIAALTLDNAPVLSEPSGWSNLIAARPTWHGTYAVNRAEGSDTSTSYSAVWASGNAPVSAIMLINPSASGFALPIAQYYYGQQR